ncbi:hypothetical protein EVAR_28134_1 [Eumeta japonica]|uniref:Uncharacterized protein n=1 Tax=Eumeta variegata TaxID=151549 RepID=A0A4C1VDT9_EUMVA|nr:hypothetical protein EVAR_28134_1 [Eumeta japonica]
MVSTSQHCYVTLTYGIRKLSERVYKCYSIHFWVTAVARQAGEVPALRAPPRLWTWMQIETQLILSSVISDYGIVCLVEYKRGGSCPPLPSATVITRSYLHCVSVLDAKSKILHLK